MKKDKIKTKFNCIFTLTMCFVLMLVALSVTYAYLWSKKYVGGTVTIHTINVNMQNSSSTSIVGSSITIGEANSSDVYSYTAKVKNTGTESCIIRFYVGLISSGSVVKSTLIVPVLAGGSGYSWKTSNGYHYLSTTAGARLTVAKDTTYNMFTGFTINDTSGALDSSIDSNGNVTFGVQVQCLQYNIGTSISSCWSDVPSGW